MNEHEYYATTLHFNSVLTTNNDLIKLMRICWILIFPNIKSTNNCNVKMQVCRKIMDNNTDTPN